MCIVNYLSRPKIIKKKKKVVFTSLFVGVCLCSSSAFLSSWVFFCISETIHALLLGRPNAVTGLMKMIQSLEKYLQTKYLSI